MYNNFVDKINTRVDAILSEIETIYNFDLGDEFEIGICKLLKVLLPEKYGVCRGHVITKDGKQAGDDIIIYDKHNFPILRMLNEDSLWRKQFIPVEAVYAYIEAKNTLYINSDTSNGQSLGKAINQVNLVKSLPRASKPIGDIDRYIKFGETKQNMQGWPKIRNPMYGCILSRNIKLNKTDSATSINQESLRAYLYLCTNPKSPKYVNDIKYPDLIIAGKDHIAVPKIDSELKSPFLIDGESCLDTFSNTQGKAFGIGLSTFIYALNAIDLKDMYWPEIIADAANVELTNAEQ